MTDTKKIIAGYVWIGGDNSVRHKVKIITELNLEGEELYNPSNYPEWNYDGSSCKQAETIDSEIILKPVKVYKDYCNSFTSLSNNYECVLVLCESYENNEKPAKGNYREFANRMFSENENMEPWFGFELEFFIVNKATQYPLGFHWTQENKSLFSSLWGTDEYTLPHGGQGPYYCSVGSTAEGRQFLEKVLERCLLTGLNITGYNFEVAPGQAEFQVRGVGIDASDQFIMLKYILQSTSEEFNYFIDYHPKPLKEFNGSGCHINFSTKRMREKGGIDQIIHSIQTLSQFHKETLEHYGSDNHYRMTGTHETSSYDKFSYGVGNRQASVRIPNATSKNMCGYFEDRRPASNIDPYDATSTLFNYSCLHNKVEL